MSKIKTLVKIVVMLVGHLQLLLTLRQCTERNTLNISKKIQINQTLNLICQNKRSLIAFQLNHHVVTAILKIALLLQELDQGSHLKASIQNIMLMIQITASDFEREMPILNL